mgnify:CR=1 FL=1
MILLVILSSNIINFITIEFQTVFFLEMQKNDVCEANYSYSSFNVNQLTFVFGYSDEFGIVEDVLSENTFEFIK